MVNSAALCRGDIEPGLCMNCLNDSIVKLREVCPNQKEAIGTYDNCLLKYSTRSLLGNPKIMDYHYVLFNIYNSTDSVRFIGAVAALINDLKADAASGGLLLKFATGNTTGPDFKKIDGLVQCSPDLTEIQCRDCLEYANYLYVRDGHSESLGGTIILPTCRYSYGLDPFFNVNISESSVPSSSSSPSPSLRGTNVTCLDRNIFNRK
ncbi:cysteine-rich repeat secretory protein 38-like [Bidens hawaiensis]|uniref:cysteine-rich repeat secretory protein 38-like n=1 Tax=Bidens hawaiensis TaxID=980011 RepID=UPI00404B0153